MATNTAKTNANVQTRPYLLALNQIQVATDTSSKGAISQKILDKVVEGLRVQKCNLILPMACLSEADNDQYLLLTGLPIVEAAKAAGLQQLWVLLIAAPKAEALKILEQQAILVKFNETVVEPQDFSDFINFLNNKKSELTKVPGIGEKTAEKIAAQRPYADWQDVQRKLGTKRSLNWVRAFLFCS